ncbi:hypothetical protein HPB47_009584, partial [Ixodes persulcatus]
HGFIIYEGKRTAEDHGFGISGDIVCDLLKDLPAHQNYKVFFDSWFTSLRLAKDPKTKEILAVGTVRVDRTEKCPLASDTAKAVKRRSVSSNEGGAVSPPEKSTRPVTPRPVTDVRFD